MAAATRPLTPCRDSHRTASIAGRLGHRTRLALGALLWFCLIAREDVRVKRRVRVTENLIVDPKSVRRFQQRVTEDGHVAQEEPTSLFI